MKKSFIVGIALVLLIIAGIVFFYIKYQKPFNENNKEIELRDVSIKIFDDTKNIETGFIIEAEGSYIDKKSGNITYYYTKVSEENSSDLGYVQAKIPVNNSFYVYNKNLKNQTYYQTKQKYSTLSGTQRVDFVLQESGYYNLSHNGSLDSGKIVFSIKSIGLTKNNRLCISWGRHIVTVQTTYNKDEEAKKQFNKDLSIYDKCFIIGDLKDETKDVEFEVSKYSSIDETDYLKLAVIDGDNVYGAKDITYFDKTRDIGAKNANYTITS